MISPTKCVILIIMPKLMKPGNKIGKQMTCARLKEEGYCSLGLECPFSHNIPAKYKINSKFQDSTTTSLNKLSDVSKQVGLEVIRLNKHVAEMQSQIKDLQSMMLKMMIVIDSASKPSSMKRSASTPRKPVG